MQNMKFAIPEKDQQAFSLYYKKHIAPKCQKYEAQRQPLIAEYKRRAKFIQPINYIGFASVLSAFVLIFYSAFFLGFEGYLFFVAFGWAFLSMVILVGINLWGQKELSQFKSNITEELFSIIVGYFGQSFQLNPKSLPRIDTYQDYGLFPKYDAGYFCNSLQGKYKQVSFLVRDIVLQNKTTENNTVKYETIFDGIIVEFDLPKRFSGITQIRHDKGMFGNRFHLFKSDLNRVKLEDVEFEKVFEVYSDDQVTARYLLTTAMMAQILSLSHFYGSQLEACFKEGKLLLKIATKHKYFNPQLDVFQPLDLSNDIAQLFQELNEIFALIDALNLDSRTGL